MTNISDRRTESLNGRWDVIVDLFACGESMGVQNNLDPASAGRFIEYSFSGRQLEVPGDWNSQSADLLFYESSVWYRRNINFTPKPDERIFLWFGAANYICDVFLNGEKLGRHEGGFSPFEFEVTDKLRDGDNVLIAHVNNRRDPSYIPAMKFDWWNYGGLTREVFLVRTPNVYIRDYTVRLDSNNPGRIWTEVVLSGGKGGEKIKVSIPELDLNKTVTADKQGKASFTATARPMLWSPANPKLYDVTIEAGDDKMAERIGFRTIETRGGDLLLNGQKIFLKGVNCHEEIPQLPRRAYSEADARMLLDEVAALGCNFLRLTHYPASEPMVRMAEERGIMLWEEVPLWQNIAFSNPATLPMANGMLDEMIARDKNRCSIIFWSVANETEPGADRNRVLAEMVRHTREADPSRLVACAFSHTRNGVGELTLDDPAAAMVDVIGINKYYGWYAPWEVPPQDMKWNVPYGKPVIFSEFGSEALYGNHGSESYLWQEEYQAQNYRDNLAMLPTIPNLVGTSPWVLFDFRSPYRMNAEWQQGWNRKGLISDRGYRKMAWHVLKEYYDSIK